MTKYKVAQWRPQNDKIPKTMCPQTCKIQKIIRAPRAVPDASPRGRPPLSMRLVVGGGGGGASGLDGSQGADILQPQPQHAQHTLRRCVSAPHPCAARRWRPPSALRDSDAPFLFQPGFDMDYTLAQVRSGLLAGTAPRKGETPARRHSHSRRPSRGVWGTCSLPTAVPTQLAQPLAPRHC